MAESIDARFGLVDRVPHKTEWLTDNGSAYTAHEARTFALSMGLLPAPRAGPEPRVQAFVKTFMRDYVHLGRMEDARVVACVLLYDRVLPFYETLGVPVGAILTDNGREFCGRSEIHPYELLTAMEGIEHRTTKVRSPRTNGFVERMNRTMLDECFRVSGRTT